MYVLGKSKSRARGFTLVELAISLCIVAILCAIVVIVVREIQTRSKTARVSADLKQIQSAVGLMFIDTGKWPKGCPPYGGYNPETYVNETNSGFIVRPPTGPTDTELLSPECNWTTTEVAAWNGPYITNAVDPWGNAYYFDPDYYTCVGGINKFGVAIQSFGPDGAQLYPTSADNGNGVPCTTIFSDDIYLLIGNAPQEI